MTCERNVELYDGAGESMSFSGIDDMSTDGARL
jgi:hypothetical protein